MTSSTRKIWYWTICGILILLVGSQTLLGQPQKSRRASGLKTIQLPSPSLTGSVSVEEAISKQQQGPGLTDKPLSFEHIGQLAWAGMALANMMQIIAAVIRSRCFFSQMKVCLFISPDSIR